MERKRALEEEIAMFNAQKAAVTKVGMATEDRQSVEAMMNGNIEEPFLERKFDEIKKARAKAEDQQIDAAQLKEDSDRVDKEWKDYQSQRQAAVQKIEECIAEDQDIWKDYVALKKDSEQDVNVLEEYLV